MADRGILPKIMYADIQPGNEGFCNAVIGWERDRQFWEDSRTQSSGWTESEWEPTICGFPLGSEGHCLNPAPHPIERRRR